MGGAASITDVPEELKEDYELFFSEGTTQSDLKVMIKICAADYENIQSAQPGLSRGEILQIIKRKLQSQKESYIMEGAPEKLDPKMSYILLSSPGGLASFVSFLREDCENDIAAGKDGYMMNLLDNLFTNSTSDFGEFPDDAVRRGYLMPAGGFSTIQGVVQPMAETTSALSSKRRILLLLIATAFPRFAASKIYEKWIDQQLSSKTTSTLDIIEQDGRDERLDSIFSFKDETTAELITSALNSFDTEELVTFFGVDSSWLDQLLAIVEDIPVCVSLATARADRPGFPLIYVNRHFEATTMYTRQEIVGKNCRFLQNGPSVEPEQVEALRNALSSAMPVKVALTNYRQDGTPFKNLLAMKPIFDSEGNYRFVLGCQIDATDESSATEQMRLVGDLLSIFPSVM